MTDGNPSVRTLSSPAQAGIDLIYEIGGSAVSQGDGTTASGAGFKTANFFLRQYAQGMDSCGLTPCSAPNVPTPAFATQAPATQGAPVCIPLVTCPGSSPPPVPVPCISLLNLCSSPTPTPAPKPSSTPTPLPLPLLPLPSPSLPIGIGYHVAIDDAGTQYWPVRYR
ncbi:MAG: hypothetical protein E6J45_08715 [Chloroflexi bacterium]|nr:MAG: hypothetical protein E6J45_08715 [Chloroflexota bacterium]